MDNFSSYYGWFVVAVTALPGVMRLAIPRQVAEVTHDRMNSERKRRRYRMYGWISVVSSIALAPVYLWLAPKNWIVVAIGLGLLTGVEMIGNAAAADASTIERQNRVFGVLYAAACVGVYLLLIH